MMPSQIILQPSVSWWFYAFMVVFTGGVGWIIYQGVLAIRLLVVSSSLRKELRGQTHSAKIITLAAIVRAVPRLFVAVVVAYGMYVMVRDIFCSFQRLKVSDSSMTLSCEWPWFDQKVPLNSVQNIRLIDKGKRHYHLEIVTTNGEILRSVVVTDEVPLSDCRRLITSFDNNQRTSQGSK